MKQLFEILKNKITDLKDTDLPHSQLSDDLRVVNDLIFRFGAAGLLTPEEVYKLYVLSEITA